MTQGKHMNQLIIILLFAAMLSMIISQHFKLMESFKQTDRAIAVAEEWKKVAERH